MENNTEITSYGKLYTVANYVGASVVSAFFASLERCSCINLSTSDNDDEEDAMDRGLICANFTRHDDPRHALPAPPPSSTATTNNNAGSSSSVDSLPFYPRKASTTYSKGDWDLVVERSLFE